MAIFTNYKIKQNDTLPLIAQRFLGDSSRWIDIVSLNNLRYPYITEDVYESIGIAKAYGNLTAPLYIGSSSTNILDYINSGEIPPSLLTSNAIFFLRRYTNNGDYVHDTFLTDSYYPNTVQIQKGSELMTYTAGTVSFVSTQIAAPTFNAEDTGLLSIVDNPSNPTSALKQYYVRYTYMATSGETSSSPNKTNSITGASIAYTVPIGKRLQFTAPIDWESGVVGVRVYVGTAAGQEMYQQIQLSTEGSVYTEPSGGIVQNIQFPPESNTAYSGAKNFYPNGSQFSIHDSASSQTTRVLKTGDTVRLPIQVNARNNIIGNYAKTDEFIDSLGKDIYLTENGFLQFAGEGMKDLSTVSGLNNLKQNINARLITRINHMMTQPRFGNYGLALIGSKYTPGFLNKLRGLLIRTILSESRVQSVMSMKLTYIAQTGKVMVESLSIKIAESGTIINFAPIAIPI